MFGDTVTRIHSENNEVVGKPIRVGDNPMAIAVSEDGAFVFNALDGTVTRIDTKTGKVLSTSPRVIGRAAGNPDFAGIAAADGAVWVVSPSEGTVVRLDAKMNEPVGEPIQVGSGPVSVAADEGAVWVANIDEATVTHIDPETNEVVGEAIALEGSPSSVAVGDGGAWVATTAGTVIWIDAASNEAGDPITVGGSPQGIAYGDGVLWAADVFNGTAMRIEP
jgi:DNA-binding beta-propeller fold protein YncE